jgi:hypothetical protein
VGVVIDSVSEEPVVIVRALAVGVSVILVDVIVVELFASTHALYVQAAALSDRSVVLCIFVEDPYTEQTPFS